MDEIQNGTALFLATNSPSVVESQNIPAFHSGFHPYPIIAIAADDASAAAEASAAIAAADNDDWGAVGDDGSGGDADDSGIRACV